MFNHKTETKYRICAATSYSHFRKFTLTAVVYFWKLCYHKKFNDPARVALNHESSHGRHVDIIDGKKLKRGKVAWSVVV
jgi:hypothetical protein